MSENIVSIIVCAYNQEDTIARTLEGILRQQSRLPFEIIIGDDCSKDRTCDICKQYEQQNPDIIHLIARPENLGVVDNYYDCVHQARGQYIMECGGDDEWCPGRIDLCLDIMEKYPNVVQVFTDVWYRNSTGKIYKVHTSPFPYGLLKGKDVVEGMLHQRSDQLVSYAMTRRDAILQLVERYPQFFSGRRYKAEDKQLKTLLGTVGDFYYVNAYTYYYSIDSSSITHTHNEVKLYNYNKNMLIMTHDLAEVLHYDHRKLAGIYSDTLYIMLSRIFLANDRTLLTEAKNIAKEFHITYTNKTKMLLLVMSNSVAWRTFRRIFLALHHAIG